MGATALVALPVSLSATSAYAQDAGHEEGGGHEAGGGKGGKGGGGHGGGHGGEPTDPVVAVAPASGNGSGAGTYAAGAMASSGTYLRFELGGARSKAGDANWLPPGYPTDPQVFFDLDMDNSAFAAVAVGHDYGAGWRAEIALNAFGRSNFAGPWSYTVPVTTGPHASMEGSVRSVALMANGYYDFDLGNKVKPFVTAGLGLAQNSMNWSRIDPAGNTRSFERSSNSSLAWSVGLGLSVDVGPIIGKAPATFEIAWRYHDLGTAKGSAQSLTGGGGGGGEGPGGIPTAPLNFDLTQQVVSIGLRIPLN
ncbi:MAG: outer membrane protein [Paracoccaceae bacterium]